MEKIKRWAGAGMVIEKDTGKMQTAASSARGADSADGVAEREARIKRIQDERLNVPPNMRRAYKEIQRFRGEIKDFKDSTYKLSKKFIMDLEDAAKKDRIAWMQRAHEFE